MTVMAANAQQKPAFVQFERRAVEDREASSEAGHPVYRDVDYVIATAPGGGSTTVEKPAEKFLKEKEGQARADGSGAMRQFYDHYKASYEAWKNDQELPVDGTPLKVWPPITPAQIKTCGAVHIRTVEDLATCGDEELSRIGPGARALQNKALAWLQSAQDHGKVSEQMASLKRDLAEKDETIERLNERIRTLEAQVDGDAPKKRGPGRPRKTEEPDE